MGCPLQIFDSISTNNTNTQYAQILGEKKNHYIVKEEGQTSNHDFHIQELPLMLPCPPSHTDAPQQNIYNNADQTATNDGVGWFRSGPVWPLVLSHYANIYFA